MDHSTCFLCVLHQLTHTIKLHLVVDGAKLCALLKAISDFGRLGQRGQLLHELVVHRLRHKAALDCDAHLATVHEGCLEDALRCLLDRGSVQHDGCIVATELQSEALQSACCGSLNELACSGAASEADLGDVRMLCDQLSQCIVATDDVHHTRREAFLKALSQHQCRQWCVRGRLEHDGVPSHNSLADLPNSHQRWEIPWSDATDDPQGYTLLNNGLLFVVNQHIVLHLQLRECAQECDATSHLLLGSRQ